MTKVIFGKSIQDVNHKFIVSIDKNGVCKIFHRWVDNMSMKQTINEFHTEKEEYTDDVCCFIYEAIAYENLMNESVEIQGVFANRNFAKTFKNFIKKNKLSITVVIEENL